MSFFSKKLPENKELPKNSGVIIKTMQDDLNTINGVIYQEATLIKEDSLQNPPRKLQEKVTTNIIQDDPSNQNPFIPQEQLQTKPQTTPQDKSITTPEEKQNLLIETTSSPMSKSVISLIILIILVSIGGIYYFIKTRTALTDTGSQQNAITPQDKPSVTEEKKSSIFSTDAPNYLPIDTINSTPQLIQNTLLQTAQQVAIQSNGKLVEFFISDVNNDPVTFATFTKLSGINFSQATLNALNGKFSLFIYTNNQQSHIGLSIEVKDKNSLQLALKQEEPTLIQTLSPLFLNDIPTQLTQSFSDGTYKNIPLRYMNIHPETSLSIDYAFVNQHLIIGTSMETHHALLDTIQ